MAQAPDPNDPNNMGQQIASGWPGMGILMMLKRLSSAAPGEADKAMQNLGIQPQAQAQAAVPAQAQQQMPWFVPRDAQQRPIPVDPRTGSPIDPNAGEY